MFLIFRSAITQVVNMIYIYIKSPLFGRERGGGFVVLVWLLNFKAFFEFNWYEIYKQPLICILDKQEGEKVENTSPIVFLPFKNYCHWTDVCFLLFDFLIFNEPWGLLDFYKFTNRPLICIIDKQEAELCTRKSYIIGQLLPNMITKANNG